MALRTWFSNSVNMSKKLIAVAFLSSASLLYYSMFISWPHLSSIIANTSVQTGSKAGFVLSGPTPQTTEEDEYLDRLVALNTSDPETSSNINFNGLRYAIIIPTFEGHFPQAIEFFQSLMCLCTDYSDIDIHVIVSDSYEVESFRQALDTLEACGESFSRFSVPAKNIDGSNPQVNVVNFYDILPSAFQSDDITPDNTSALLHERGKYQYQSIKKLSAATRLEYDYALWLDSEAIIVRPFSLRETFDAYIKTPTIWRSRMSKTDYMLSIMRNSARILGRSLNSFGLKYWNLESVEWIIEKEVINDMFQYVEDAHGQDFWSVWARHGGTFEINLYNMHIQARKLETVNSIFSKYMVLETEREMIRFGMAPAFPHMEHNKGTGFLERGYELLRTQEIQPHYSAFLRRYGQRLFRLEDLGVADPQVIDRFLLDTPIDILCSGAPRLHRWWEERILEANLTR